MICAPDPDTVIVSMYAMRWVILFCGGALCVALGTILGSIENDPGPPSRLGK